MSKNRELKSHLEHPQMLADTIQVEIVSVEKAIFSGRTKVVIATGEEGELGIFPGHTQMLVALKPGEVRLIAKDGEEDCYYISGGFMEVQPDVVTILADTVLRANELDEKRALNAKARAEELLATKKYDNYTAALVELHKALAQLRVIKRGKVKM